MLKPVTIKMELELLEQLDAYALRYGLNRSEALREMIERVLHEEYTKRPLPLAKVEKIRL